MRDPSYDDSERRVAASITVTAMSGRRNAPTTRSVATVSAAPSRRSNSIAAATVAADSARNSSTRSWLV